MIIKKILDHSESPHDVAIIESLKASALPVVLYGASIDVADQIVKKLLLNDIVVDAVAYDDDCPMMTESTVLLKNIETIPIKDIDSKLSAYNVIIGFVKGYFNIDSVASKFKNAKSVGYLSEIFDMEVVTRSFIEANNDFLTHFYENLQDQHSKDSYIAYLMAKVMQDMQFLPPVFEKVQYFPKGIFELTAQESYFDCGAFTGDTIADFLKATGGSYRHIWAAEPDGLNYNRLIQYVKDENLTNIDVIHKGIYSATGNLPFRATGNMLSMFADSAENCIEVDTIDNIVAGNPVTFIKMDVEGAELQALQGAEQTIKRCKPILGISIYHKQNDLIDIPALIQSIVPTYKFYFRVHKKLAIDTVLYGIIK